jgi:hypothetical protein
MGAGTTNRSKTKAKGRGLETMMINFSYYELDDLLEIREALDEAIKKKEAEEKDLAFEQEDRQLEEGLEEFRDL